MDTEALWQAIAAYGNARWRGVKFEQDAADHLSEIKAILNRAEAETRELLATNERLVDEVNELKSKLTKKAELLRGCYAADHKQKQRIEELTAELERIKALPPAAWRTFDGEGGYDYRTYEMNESYAEDYAKRNPNHAHWVDPLIALGSKT